MASNREKKLLEKDAADRKLILEALDSNIVVEASAGTGKTTSMVGRMIELLASGKCADPANLAAVTFTRKAAAELRSRFRVELEKRASEEKDSEKKRNLLRAIAGIDRAYIGTIHSFCAKLLRERPVEAGVDLDFEELDDVEDYRLRMEVWRRFALESRRSNGEAASQLEALGVSVADLESAYKSICDYDDVEDWPLMKKAQRSSDFNAKWKRVEDYVSHMGKLAPDLPDDYGNDTIIPRYKDIPRVYHYYKETNDIGRIANFLESRFDYTAKITQREWKKTGKFTGDDAKAELAKWNEFRYNVVTPMLDEIRLMRQPAAMNFVLAARRFYDDARLAGRKLNYQDLLKKTAAMLKTKANVRETFARRYTHLMVDEFQDTDPLQAEVMLYLTATDPNETDWRRCKPRAGSLFVVGDPKQSIYRFRRADIVTYNTVRDIVKRNGGIEVRLAANFRSHESVREWVNRVFESESKDGEPTDEKAMLRFPEEETPESPTYFPLLEGRVESDGGGMAGVFTLTVDESKKDDFVDAEAGRIARTIRAFIDDGQTVARSKKDLAKGIPATIGYSDILIIARNTTNLGAYAAKLQEYGVPHQVTGGAALNRISELRLLHYCLNACMKPDDPVALLGALRSESFGVSDAALYRFKKAGGEFDFNSRVPEGLSVADKSLFTDAFEKLKNYRLWLASMPPVSAFEMVARDLGLSVVAGLKPGGDYLTGGLAKAIEIIRGAQSSSRSTLDLVNFLGTLIAEEEKHDGLSARSDESPRVRVMNLHKAKGLEAPIVFLVDPSGDSDHKVKLHVDRERNETRGFMAIYKDTNGFQPKLMAIPKDWEDYEIAERKFDAAERLRLRYVATTRAGSALIVSVKPGGKNTTNPWRHFYNHLDKAPELADPGPRAAPKSEAPSLDETNIAKSISDIEERMKSLAEKSREEKSAKDFARREHYHPDKISPEETPEESFDTDNDIDHGEHGVEWGSVVHALLKFAADSPDADLESLAKSLLAEHGLDRDQAKKAASVTKSVVDSEVWKRSLASKKRLTEVPFELFDNKSYDKPTIIRGAIDLAFLETDGWVIVDYKTDSVNTRTAQSAAAKHALQLEMYANCWERLTGDKVKVKYVYFTALNETYTV